MQSACLLSQILGWTQMSPTDMDGWWHFRHLGQNRNELALTFDIHLAAWNPSTMILQISQCDMHWRCRSAVITQHVGVLRDAPDVRQQSVFKSIIICPVNLKFHMVKEKHSILVRLDMHLSLWTRSCFRGNVKTHSVKNLKHHTKFFGIWSTVRQKSED